MLSKYLNYCLFICTIFILIIISLVSCSSDLSSSDVITDSSVNISDTNIDKYNDAISKFTKIDNSLYFDVYVHNYTGVCYVYTSYGEFNPLYNSDGSLLIYSI